MPSPTAAPNPPPSPDFIEAFRADADAAGRMPFDRFMTLALYHPTLGYYRRDKKRVGYGRDTDFYTASTSGPLFGELVHAACRSLLGSEKLANTTFVELGAEPASSILSGVQHGFDATQTIRIGEPITLTGQCVVFSNELFDAQPFRRFQFTAGTWRELGVQWCDGVLREETFATSTLPARLPPHAAEGYRLDLPLASVALAEKIAAEPWTGLFVAFDYGKPWRELLEAAPAGTARAYHRHTQTNDLLARPGEQDLTCHICWDWLAEALRKHHFADPQVASQEAFLIRHAADFLANTVAAEATQLSQRKLGLLQLLHHLGQKFQVLWALREK